MNLMNHDFRPQAARPPGIHSINHLSIRVPNFDSEPCGKSESDQENVSEKMQQNWLDFEDIWRVIRKTMSFEPNKHWVIFEAYQNLKRALEIIFISGQITVTSHRDLTGMMVSIGNHPPNGRTFLVSKICINMIIYRNLPRMTWNYRFHGS